MLRFFLGWFRDLVVIPLLQDTAADQLRVFVREKRGRFVSAIISIVPATPSSRGNARGSASASVRGELKICRLWS
jgi:hypothetical protein